MDFLALPPDLVFRSLLASSGIRACPPAGPPAARRESSRDFRAHSCHAPCALRHFSVFAHSQPCERCTTRVHCCSGRDTSLTRQRPHPTVKNIDVTGCTSQYSVSPTFFARPPRLSTSVRFPPAAPVSASPRGVATAKNASFRLPSAAASNLNCTSPKVFTPTT